MKHQIKKKKHFELRAIISTAIVLGCINLCLDSLWLHIMYKKAFIVYLGARVITQVVMFPVYIATIIVLERVLKKPIKRYLYREEEEE